MVGEAADGSSSKITAMIRKRELGFSSPSTFTRCFSASQETVKRINLHGLLNGHRGCVNTLEFNSTGHLLLSGSDDRQVIFWDWATATKQLSYSSGHSGNIFQTQIMPFTDDRTIVTSSADGQVRLGHVLENGQVDTKRLAKHQGRVHSLAVEPGSPYILYSCGEDGFVQHFDLRSKYVTKLLSTSSFTKNKDVGLNAIVIDPRNPNYFALGGSDEFVRIYDTRKCQVDTKTKSVTPMNTFCPQHLIKTNHVHITGLAYSNTSEIVATYNDELIYLFEKNMGLGPSPLSISPEFLQGLENPKVYSGHRNAQTVKGVSFFGPNDDYIMSGSDCGHIFIWNKKKAKLVRLMVGDRRIVNQLKPHPHMPIFATCGLEKSVKIWAPSGVTNDPLPSNLDKIMESNRQGREDHSGSHVMLTPDVVMHILRLQRRQPLAFSGREDENNGDADLLGFLDSEDSSDEEGNSRECNVS
ncbi:hypothetical protein ACFE04_004993 [Oxalis oulophora]